MEICLRKSPLGRRLLESMEGPLLSYPEAWDIKLILTRKYVAAWRGVGHVVSGPDADPDSFACAIDLAAAIDNRRVKEIRIYGGGPADGGHPFRPPRTVPPIDPASRRVYR